MAEVIRYCFLSNDIQSAWDEYYYRGCVLTDEMWKGIRRYISQRDPSSDRHMCWTSEFWMIVSCVYDRLEEEERPAASMSTLLAEMFKDGRGMSKYFAPGIALFVYKVYGRNHKDIEAREDFFKTIMVNDYAKEIIFGSDPVKDDLEFQAYVNKLIGSGSMTKSANKK